MRYGLPIKSAAHADWCLREAELAYGGTAIVDDYGMSLIEDGIGLRHTDDVLRALSHFRHRSDGSKPDCWCVKEGEV